jgi:hypothetical protein
MSMGMWATRALGIERMAGRERHGSAGAVPHQWRGW